MRTDVRGFQFQFLFSPFVRSLLRSFSFLLLYPNFVEIVTLRNYFPEK